MKSVKSNDADEYRKRLRALTGQKLRLLSTTPLQVV
jgi:hypothetical protein